MAGPVAVLAALVWLLVLAVRWWRRYDHRVGDQLEPRWLEPAAVAVASAVLVLYRPGITPDHPWADRRLVPVVLPLVRARRGGRAGPGSPRWPGGPRSVGVVAAVPLAGVAALVVPAWLGTAGRADARTETGQRAAARQVCARLRPGDVVVGVGPGPERVAAAGPRPVRVPGGVVAGPAGRCRRRAAGCWPGSGRRPDPGAAAADDAGSLASLGLTAERVLGLASTEDQRSVTPAPGRRPAAGRGRLAGPALTVPDPALTRPPSRFRPGRAWAV